MVFNGDWNGGERRFNIRPRQELRLESLERAEGGRSIAMVRDSSLDDVDDYAFTDDTTLRWRSRMATDAPFENATRTYVIRYQLSNTLLRDAVLKNGDDYTLDHDFLFPDRQGVITRASVALTFDPAWQPQTEVRSLYTADQVPPGKGLVVTIPLRYTGAGVPVTLATNLPPVIVRALWALLLLPIVVIGWVFARERWYGRFAPLHTRVDEAWIREHILKHPAEVVTAAWDDRVEGAEVVALIARLVAEGKLKSGTSKKRSMTLYLAVDREKLDGYERALVDGLFFQKRIETSTASRPETVARAIPRDHPVWRRRDYDLARMDERPHRHPRRRPVGIRGAAVHARRAAAGSALSRQHSVGADEGVINPRPSWPGHRRSGTVSLAMGR